MSQTRTHLREIAFQLEVDPSNYPADEGLAQALAERAEDLLPKFKKLLQACSIFGLGKDNDYDLDSTSRFWLQTKATEVADALRPNDPDSCFSGDF